MISSQKKFSFRHLGIACPDIEACKNFLKSVMNIREESEIIFDEKQNASLCLLTLSDGIKLELISGPMVANMVKKGITYYHTCYAVFDIDQALARLKKDHKVTVISEIKPGKLFNGQRTVFIYTPIGIIELLEDKL